MPSNQGAGRCQYRIGSDSIRRWWTFCVVCAVQCTYILKTAHEQLGQELREGKSSMGQVASGLLTCLYAQRFSGQLRHLYRQDRQPH